MRDNIPSFIFLCVETISLAPFAKKAAFSLVYVFDSCVYKLGIFEGLESVECDGTSDFMDPLGKHFPAQSQH